MMQMILRRSQTDRVFRDGLLSDPDATLHAAFGIRVTDGYRVRFIEKGTELDALIVLPDALPDVALDTMALDRVVGGAGDVAWFDVLQ